MLCYYCGHRSPVVPSDEPAYLAVSTRPAGNPAWARAERDPACCPECMSPRYRAVHGLRRYAASLRCPVVRVEHDDRPACCADYLGPDLHAPLFRRVPPAGAIVAAAAGHLTLLVFP